MDDMKPDNEEYQLTEDQDEPRVVNTKSAHQKPLAFDEEQRKNIFTTIGFFITMFILYKIISALFASAPKKVEPAPVVATKIESPQTVVKAELDEETKTKLMQQGQIVSQVQGNLTAMQEQMTAMTAVVQDVSQQLKKFQEQLAAEKVVKEKPKPVVKLKSISRPEYFIKALIPGRAWLLAADGSTLTISSGDYLPGYGTVDDINIEQGVVMTSSGDMIHYRSDDS